MKILSDNAVTKSDIDAVDAKQTRQINQLRILVGVSFAVNVVLTIALRLF